MRRKRRRRLLGGWIPTEHNVVRAMLQIARVNAEDVVYDLGCGDGRILIMAVKEFGAKRAVGYELRDEPYTEALSNIKRENLQDKITVNKQDIFESNFADASVITLYMGGKANELLRPKLEKKARPGTRVISHQFKIYSWRIDSQKETNPNSDTMIFRYVV